LRLLLKNPETINENFSTTSIFNELTNICIHLVDRKYHSSADAVDIFEIILKNYLLLLDTNEFVVTIIPRYLLANNHFLSYFVRFSASNDIENIGSWMENGAREKLYYRLLDQISSSIRIVSFLKNIKQSVLTSCEVILVTVLRVLCHIQYSKIDVSMIKLKKYQKTLFIPFITFIDEQISTNKSSENDILIACILKYLRGLSKHTSTIPILININCSQTCLQWLSLSYLNYYEYKSIINILFNIARHDEGAIILNKSECSKIVRQFKNEILNRKFDFMIHDKTYEDLNFIVNMLIVLTENYENIDNHKIIRDSLLPAIDSALNSFTFKYHTFDVLDLLIILMKLFTNDNIVNYVLRKYTFSGFFCDVLDGLLVLIGNNFLETWEDDKMTLSAIVLVNIFWSISFQVQYKNDLIQKLDFIKTLETRGLPNTLTSRHIFSLKRSIDGIYQNLYPTISSISVAKKSLRSLVISCSYIDIDFGRKLYDVLVKTMNVSICIDSDNWKQIAQTIHQSDIILFLISKDFYNNKSCRQELIYVTDILKKLFIPVFINSDYQAIGWLHQRIDTIKSIRFEEEDVLNTCEELLSMIINLSPVENASNDSDVKQWFIKNDILLELYEFYQFKNIDELILYAQAIFTFPWTKEYERIKSRFDEKFLELNQNLSAFDFLKFMTALERLRN
jgi:hypothetical protein